MREWVKELPGGDGWWHPQDGEEFDQLATGLVTLGLTEQQAEDALTRAYAATANEFGS